MGMFGFGPEGFWQSRQGMGIAQGLMGLGQGMASSRPGENWMGGMSRGLGGFAQGMMGGRGRFDDARDQARLDDQFEREEELRASWQYELDTMHPSDPNRELYENLLGVSIGQGAQMNVQRMLQDQSMLAAGARARDARTNRRTDFDYELKARTRASIDAAGQKRSRLMGESPNQWKLAANHVLMIEGRAPGWENSMLALGYEPDTPAEHLSDEHRQMAATYRRMTGQQRFEEGVTQPLSDLGYPSPSGVPPLGIPGAEGVDEALGGGRTWQDVPDSREGDVNRQILEYLQSQRR